VGAFYGKKEKTSPLIPKKKETGPQIAATAYSGGPRKNINVFAALVCESEAA
jgi:hypothetical protein